MSGIQTREAVKAHFEDNGIVISHWAEERKLDISTVYAVLNGRAKGKRGEAHRAAVALGIKKPAPGRGKVHREAV